MRSTRSVVDVSDEDEYYNSQRELVRSGDFDSDVGSGMRVSVGLIAGSAVEVVERKNDSAGLSEGDIGGLRRDSGEDMNGSEDYVDKIMRERHLIRAVLFLFHMCTCQPVLTPWPTIAALLVLGLALTPVGVVYLVSSSRMEELDVRYDVACEGGGHTCANMAVRFTVERDIPPPVFVYYKLTNFYQNHRAYVKSRSYAQLRGVSMSESAVSSDCDPLVTNDKGEVYLPCGLTAWSVFNDSLVLMDAENVTVGWDDRGVAWPSDVQTKYANPRFDAEGTRVLRDGIVVRDFEDEDFMVWMRLSALPTFRKLFRVIDKTLHKGTYYMRIANHYPADAFDGEKHFVITSSSWIGTKNPFLGYVAIVVGGLCVFLSLGFAFMQCLRPRRFADPSLLSQYSK